MNLVLENAVRLAWRDGAAHLEEPVDRVVFRGQDFLHLGPATRSLRDLTAAELSALLPPPAMPC